MNGDKITYGYMNATYGNYVVLNHDENVDAAKAAMLEQIKGLIDELSQDERFWIVKDMVNFKTIGWQIFVPQLADFVDSSVAGGHKECKRRLSVGE